MAKGYVKNCHIVPKAGDRSPFHYEADGRITPHLDGYAIIPIEQYQQLYGAQGFCPEDHWPCQACGAKGPDENGHDPCISNLPGVIHACCGHGRGHAYAMFSDGKVIRGHFDVEDPAALEEQEQRR